MGTTTDRNSPCIKEVRPDGQQECYLILSEEERAKGFVRPVREEYIHIKCGGRTTMARSIAETFARDNHFYGATYCVNCGQHFPLRDALGVYAFQWVGVTDETKFVGS